jgi:sialate O-acetylesterase
MIHPLAPLALRGAIWYQGESNGGEGDTYYWKTRALVNGWREVFANPDLSFYFVQLANYQGDSQTPQGGTGYALIRDAQRRSLTIPRTGMAVIIDIGEAGDIHPRNKLDVGLRLAAWALARDYGKAVVFSGPLYKSHTIDANRIRLTFDSVGGGLMVGMKKGMDPTQPVPGGQLKRFAIAGADKVWQWADAVIDGDTVVVSHAQVPAPVAVRYAYDANPIGCNLYNREGFPASPFRTDTW